jgi:hypothetical protein
MVEPREDIYMKQMHQFPWRAPTWATRVLFALVVCAGATLGLFNCNGGSVDPCLVSSAATIQTLHQYASDCFEATLITVPAFHCDNGTPVPDTGHDGGVTTCDRPNVLNHECDPGSRFQVLNENDDAFVVAHCRKKGRNRSRIEIAPQGDFV